MHPAKKLLQEDVRTGKHKYLAPLTLFHSRTAYELHFKKDKFRQRIYQEERRQKFIFQLELKRAEQQKKFKKAKANAELADSNADDEQD